MFTFSHVTSIGIDEAEYTRRLAAGETNLVKGEAKWYREIATEVVAPTTIEDMIDLLQRDKIPSEKIKLGEKSFTVPDVVKHYIVGLKLAVNQKVQAANREGDGPSNGDIVSAVIRHAKDSGDDALFARACGALASARTVKAFATAWMADHPDFIATK